MNKPLSFLRLSSLVLLGLLSTTGCLSTVTVTADAPGAIIRCRGYGRPSYRWQTVAGGIIKKPGDSCQFQTRYSTIQLYASWPDGKESEKVVVPLSNWTDPEPITLRKP